MTSPPTECTVKFAPQTVTFEPLPSFVVSVQTHVSVWPAMVAWYVTVAFISPDVLPPVAIDVSVSGPADPSERVQTSWPCPEKMPR